MSVSAIPSNTATAQVAPPKQPEPPPPSNQQTQQVAPPPPPPAPSVNTQGQPIGTTISTSA